MNSQSLVKKIVRYRTPIVATGNAAVTWTILIIAPLGLFAVIICTLAVFACSYSIGKLCDRAFLYILDLDRSREPQEFNSLGDRDGLSSEQIEYERSHLSQHPSQSNLADRRDD